MDIYIPQPYLQRERFSQICSMWARKRPQKTFQLYYSWVFRGYSPVHLRMLRVAPFYYRQCPILLQMYQESSVVSIPKLGRESVTSTTLLPSSCMEMMPIARARAGPSAVLPPPFTLFIDILDRSMLLILLSPKYLSYYLPLEKRDSYQQKLTTYFLQGHYSWHSSPFQMQTGIYFCFAAFRTQIISLKKMKPTRKSFFTFFFQRFFRLYSIIAYRKVSFDTYSSVYFAFFTSQVQLYYIFFLSFFSASYNLLWRIISWNLTGKFFFAYAIFCGLLPYFILLKMDWLIEPLLSITKSNIGGTIFDFTKF